MFSEPQNGTRVESGIPPVEEIKRQIYRYNDQQSILNEETYGPLLNDSVIIVVQVSFYFLIFISQKRKSLTLH